MAGKNWDFEYHPVGTDFLTPSASVPAPGTRVRLTPVEPGRRRDRAYAHVSDTDGNPIGLVLKASLQRTTKNCGANPQPVATDRVRAQFNDRRTGA